MFTHSYLRPLQKIFCRFSESQIRRKYFLNLTKISGHIFPLIHIRINDREVFSKRRIRNPRFLKRILDRTFGNLIKNRSQNFLVLTPAPEPSSMTGKGGVPRSLVDKDQIGRSKKLAAVSFKWL